MRINPVSWMALILLAIATLVFAVLTLFRNQDVRTYQGGDGGQDSVPALADKVQTQRGLLTKARNDLDAARHELWSLNIQLDQLQANTPPGQGAAPATGADGKPLPVETSKASTWQLALYQTEIHTKRIAADFARYDSPDWKTHPELDAAIRQRAEELNALAKRVSDEDERFKADRDQLSKQLDEIATTKDRADRSHRDEMSRLHTEATKREADIRKLLELDLTWVSELDPDGLVEQVEGDRVVIDLGSRDGIRPGLRFSVSALEKGVRIGKGMIEAIQVGDVVSTCRLVDEKDARRRPIGPGDSVASPVFERGHVPVFAVAGEFKHYTRNDLVSFIKAAGAQVADKVGPGVDFLVAGEKSEADQANARQFQIKAMTEDFLLEYVKPAFSFPTAAKGPGGN